MQEIAGVDASCLLTALAQRSSELRCAGMKDNLRTTLENGRRPERVRILRAKLSIVRRGTYFGGTGDFVWRILVVRFVWRIYMADCSGEIFCMADSGGEICMADLYGGL